jgi:hypothetical protein
MIKTVEFGLQLARQRSAIQEDMAGFQSGDRVGISSTGNGHTVIFQNIGVLGNRASAVFIKSHEEHPFAIWKLSYAINTSNHGKFGGCRVVLTTSTRFD